MYPRLKWWSLLTCLLACAGMHSGGAPVLADGYDRRPGSFCALNPEGCPPLVAPPDP
jgi:hypothetical protein